MIEYIKTDKAPEALGHYSQGTVANDTIYTATQLPINPNALNEKKGSVQDQATQVLKNVIEVVKAGGGSKDSITKIMIYISDTKHWNDVNISYEKIMVNHKPARGVLEIKNIRKGYDVSMDAIAIVDKA